MKITRTIAIAILINTPIASFAFTGNQLHQLCQVNEFGCNMYISGFFDGLIKGEKWHSLLNGNEDSNLLCPPNRFTTGQAKDIVRKFLENNPEIRHQAAPTLILDALSKTIGC